MIRLLILCFTFFLSTNAFANSTKDLLARAFKEFSTGSYGEALSLLNRIKQGSDKQMGSKFYLKGLSKNRLQRFDESIPDFVQAIKYGEKTKDIYYEYGQALYASSELEKARKSFVKSYHTGFKTITSLYYAGHVSQLLEEHKKAKQFFEQILKEEKEDKKMRQIARFQLTESMLTLTEGKSDSEISRLVEKFILPQMKLARDEVDGTDVKRDIVARISEVERRYGLDPDKFRNGKPIPAAKFKGSFTQKIQYDNNVSLADDQATVVTTKKDSYILDSTFKISRPFSWKRRFALSPALSLNYIHHTNREDSTVFTNDSYSFDPSIDGRFEYLIGKKQASTSLKYEYDYTARDKDANKSTVYYSRAQTWSLTQKVKIFKFGPTSLKLKKKFFRAHSLALENDVDTLSLDQIAILKGGKLLIFLFQYDDTDQFNDTNSSTSSMLFRTDFIWSNILPEINWNIALAYTLLDTKAQSISRGTEKTINPSTKLTKKIGDDLKVSFEYSYTDKSSLSSSNKYNKHQSTFEINYSF